MAEDPEQRDEYIRRTEEAERQEGGGRELQAANLFDLRRIIGGLFVLYGIVLTIMGLGESDREIAKAAGVHINLWAGLGMLAIGVLFIIWALARPLGQQLQEAEAQASPPPTTSGDSDVGSLASEERSGRPGDDR
jgi:hypothetical protein